ncbi:cadherin-related family member 4 isoform X2 [Perognathus longimembris pacificus]|uniref:cadherin-related family member 4 isoform X2 n=1 Tax=Perognathus longimembris pacificus TaxID=214514 RepID=UPI0020192324|nr:cadherin-related family member 4 isoform X2 [Perognathus longimembris pacificus]
MGWAGVWQSCCLAVFKQLTWQQGRPDKHCPLPSLQDTMTLLKLLTLLLALVVSGLYSLPWFKDISERQGPGTVVQTFFFNCSSYLPTLELISVQPNTTFFNPPSLAGQQGKYVGKVILSSSARLDALAVNHYQLHLRYKCGNYVMDGPLSVTVQRDIGHIQCGGRFASQAGEVIYVPETVPPGARLYTLMFPGLQAQGTKMNITSAQDPPYFPGPFSINEKGWLQAPSQGLRGQAEKAFQLQISVSTGQGQNCRGRLTVRVLRVPSSQVSFLQTVQNVTILENVAPGSDVVQVQARGSDLRYEIVSPIPSPLYSIGHDGVVRTTSPLDLTRAPGAAVTRLQVKAFEHRQPWISAELELMVNVQSVNRWPPSCLSALLVNHIPETAPVGTILGTLTCTDPDSAGTSLDYQLRFYSSPDSASIRLRDQVVEVNATLDCDAPGTCFRHVASILVIDGGQPQMTTEVPVLVLVTPVNEFSPACTPRTFRVPEDARPHTVLGFMVGVDADYPHDSVEYSISGGPSSTFAVDRLSGKVQLLAPLDYEQQRVHRVTVLLMDRGQDWNPTYRRSGSCTITIEVEDVNDHTPECEPPFQELTIHTPLGRSMEVTKVLCRIPQEPQRQAFAYSIVGGNSPSRFRMQGAVLVHDDTLLGPPWLEQPCSYRLLIRVADAGNSIYHLSTTATIIVHLVPQRASTTVTTSTHRNTVSSMMTPMLVTDIEVYWQPEPWFVAVLTATGALLLVALGWLLSKLLQGLTQVLRAPSKPAQTLLLNSIQGNERSKEGFRDLPRMERSQDTSSVTSLHFDGRAQDARTGRDYLFHTHTGVRRWI